MVVVVVGGRVVVVVDVDVVVVEMVPETDPLTLVLPVSVDDAVDPLLVGAGEMRPGRRPVPVVLPEVGDEAGVVVVPAGWVTEPVGAVAVVPELEAP